MMTRINGERLKVEKGTVVGFINPVLYANPQALNGVVTGNNTGCSGEVGFNAAKDWDLVTGLETLDVFMVFP